MQPYIQVKLLTLEGHIAALQAAVRWEQLHSTVGYMDDIIKELNHMSRSIRDNRTLDAILTSIVRADATLEREMARLRPRKRNGSR